MHLSTSIALLWCCLVLIARNQQVARAFWLTDSTLFQRPFEPTQVNVANSQSANASAASSSLLAANARTEPWIQLADKVATSTALASTSLPATGGDSASPQAACRCNADWVQSQTSLWLNKWMSSPSFAHHIQKSLAKLSNGKNGGGAGRRLAWNRTSKRHSGANGNSSQASVKKAADQPQQLEQPVKVLQGERGPKGEQGERGPVGPVGPAGPSSPISVKDRDALFDLAPAAGVATSSPQDAQTLPKQHQQQQRRLVYVESEQLLVVETQLGWRPVQMLAPLRDFRKTIAKFSLSSQEQRLRLLVDHEGQADEVENRLVVQPQVGSRKVALVGKRLRSNNKMNAILNDEDEEEDGDEEDDEDDEEEDEDDEEEADANQADKFEDVEEEEEGEANGQNGDEESDSADDNELDDGASREMNSIGRATAANLPSWQAARRLSTSVEAKAARRHRAGLVTGRSAMAPVRAVDTNMARQSDSAQLAGARKLVVPADNQAAGADLMKLRLVALNEPFAGNQHGLRGANFECKRHAARANVKGAFRALLATNYQNLNEIVRHSAHVHGNPVVNLRGETLASSWHDLLRSPVRTANPLSRIFSFDGRHVASDPNWPNKLVWLGAGGKFTSRDATQNCDGWHSDSLNKFGFAAPLHLPRNHHQSNPSQQQLHAAKAGASKHHRHQRGAELDQRANASSPLVFDAVDKYPCRMPLIVLCIETIAQGGQQY